MSLATVIRSGVKIANTVTKPVQGNVTHVPWLSADGFGGDSFGDTVNRRAIIDLRRQQRILPSGKVVLTMARLVFLDPIEANGQSDKRHEPIDEHDVFTLPDGTSGPIIDIVGLVDPSTSTEIFADEIQPTDLITQADGTVKPSLEVLGSEAPGFANAFLFEVWLGFKAAAGAG